jgi:hypothetical protein
VYDDLAEAAKLSAVLNVDESGWRILGRTAWLWCFTSAWLAYYVLTPSRAGPVIKQVLGEIFKGILITDFFGAYDRIQAFAKQKCIVHLLREIKQVSLRNHSAERQGFARRLKRLIHEALKLVIDRKRLGEDVYDRRVANLHIRLADKDSDIPNFPQCITISTRLAERKIGMSPAKSGSMGKVSVLNERQRSCRKGSPQKCACPRVTASNFQTKGSHIHIGHTAPAAGAG